jgi:hypothetical protein
MEIPMNSAHTLHFSPFQVIGKILSWLLRFAALVVFYFILFYFSGLIVGPYLPTDIAPEPGPLPLMTALWLTCAAATGVIMLTIHSSRWHGWKLILSMSVAYYVVLTVVTQLESWYFLYGLTVGPALMWRLFVQGIPIAFIFVPTAVFIMGRFRAPTSELTLPEIATVPLKEWLWKLGIIYLAYLTVYYLAGYFIAWQNPMVRAFYGSPGEPLPFFQQMMNIFVHDPWLTLFQLLRTLIWTAGALFVIRSSRFPRWETALIVGLMLSVPQNIGHLIPNAMIPLNIVRITHMIETASSTFVFGVIVAWLLYPKYVFRKS